MDGDRHALGGHQVTRKLPFNRWALGVLAAALAVRLVLPTPQPKIPVVAPHAIPVSLPASRIAASPPPSDFAVVEQRLLFNPVRQAPEPAKKKAEPQAAPPPATATLTGVILSGANRLAILRQTGSQLGTDVSVGGSLQGWTVAEIEPDHLLLRSGSFQQEIRLQSPTSNASGAMSAATPNMLQPH